jgi:hypothetical protein
MILIKIGNTVIMPLFCIAITGRVLKFKGVVQIKNLITL